MSVMPSETRPGSPLPITINLRIHEGHYAALAAVAGEYDCSISEAARTVIEVYAGEHLQDDEAVRELLGVEVEEGP